ncbi:MAG: hypothetical protein J7463_10245 [Roseiflexus sp.]|jgi:hypothetical protein|nr:hypothetical protein [Roseiflexus sp.]MBO9336987.1 hypothetical protein [Roseiflexus sp.]MBO9341126.1 hypothetical protein [Roseiflexus sp.]MBO9365923.1 hypothetical protein [Roseiflexus sp.]
MHRRRYLDIHQNGLTWDNGLALAANVGGLLLPGLTGLGMVVRGGRAAVAAASHSDEVVDAGRAVAKAAGHANDAADAARARDEAAGAAVHRAGQLHKHANHAVSYFGIYKIKGNGETYKFGKADLDRVTQSSGLPTRLHQQVRQLRKTFQDVSAEIIDDLGYVTTQQAKQAERAALQRYYETTRRIPPGNQKSFRPD